MKTSVPQVTPIKSKLIEIIGNLREAVNKRDTVLLRKAIEKSRHLYENELKTRTNDGDLKPELLERTRIALERVEIVLEHLERLEAEEKGQLQ